MGNNTIYGSDLKCTVALSGGASRGPFHLGVLSYLDDIGIKIEKISGSSIGAIIGASYCAGVSPKEQLKIFSSKDFKKIFKFNYFKNGIFSINEYSEILAELSNNTSNIKDLRIPLSVTAFDIKNGERIVFEEGELVKILLGTAALVPLFKPIKYKNYLLVDGGFVDNLPVTPLLKLELPVISVNLHPFVPYKNSTSTLKTFKRTIRNSFFYQSDNNHKTAQYQICSQDILNYPILSFKNFDQLYELGYETAQSRINIKQESK